MSVPTWKRKLSGAEYVYQLYQLNIRLGEILVNKPQKYKQNYTDAIVKAALAALEHAQIADSVYLGQYSKEQDYRFRREQLLLAKGEVQHVATACFIFLEIVRRHDHAGEGESDRIYARLYDQELEIGELCERCHKLLAGVIKSDGDLYNKYIKARSGGR